MNAIRHQFRQPSLRTRIMDSHAQNYTDILCPNCGAPATRKYLIMSDLVETACEHCDYFLVSSHKTGNVIEAYAPGLYGI